MTKQKSLKQKAAAGMVWTALQKYSSMIIRFISGIILARLLTPFDYGCIGMLSIFMVLAEVFIDSGFGSALIQKKRPTQVDYSTIFFWNIGVAVVMYAVLFVSAPTISRFFFQSGWNPVRDEWCGGGLYLQAGLQGKGHGHNIRDIVVNRMKGFSRFLL